MAILGSGNIKMFVNDNINHSFKISNIEKENIVKIINKLTDKISIGKRFISELVDHFNMIHKLRTYYPDLYLKSRTYDEFHNEHLELSKMMSLIKKGWVVEYQFVDKMVDDVEKPIDVKINSLFRSLFSPITEFLYFSFFDSLNNPCDLDILTKSIKFSSFEEIIPPSMVVI